MAEKEPKSKRKTPVKFEVETNYTTGVKYFRQVREKPLSPEDPNNVPSIDEVPPVGFAQGELTVEAPPSPWEWTDH